MSPILLPEGQGCGALRLLWFREPELRKRYVYYGFGWFHGPEPRKTLRLLRFRERKPKFAYVYCGFVSVSQNSLTFTVVLERGDKISLRLLCFLLVS